MTTHAELQTGDSSNGTEDGTPVPEPQSPPGERSRAERLLTELDNDKLTDAERLEKQFTLVSEWQVTESKIKSRILYVLESDPLTDDEDQEDDDGKLYLVYWLPIEGVAVEEFQKPIPWNPAKYKFARLVEALGYDSSSFDQVEQEEIVLERGSGDLKSVDPASGVVNPRNHESEQPETENSNPDTGGSGLLPEGAESVLEGNVGVLLFFGLSAVMAATILGSVEAGVPIFDGAPLPAGALAAFVWAAAYSVATEPAGDSDD